MNTEDIHKSEEVEFIKLPSKSAVLNGIRYLFSASTLILGALFIYASVTQMVTGSSVAIYSIFIILSGWILANYSYEDIAKRFIKLKPTLVRWNLFIKFITDFALLSLWISGLLLGIFFLAATVIFVFFKIF